jgi:hypothetical protein
MVKPLDKNITGVTNSAPAILMLAKKSFVCGWNRQEVNFPTLA